MVLKIDGTDIVPFIAFNGLQWQRQDIDGPNAGRTMDGTVVRDRIATKIRWDVTCRPLTSAELSQVLQLIQPEFVSLQYWDPITGLVLTDQFYSNNIPASYLIRKANGTEYWGGVTFPLIQK